MAPSPRFGGLRVSTAHRIAFVCLISMCLRSSLPAQTSDDIHLVPLKPAPHKPLISADVEPRRVLNPFRVDVDLVLVPVTVTDGANRTITGLAKHDFALYEAGEPQQIQYFSSEDSPISVGVILDLSKSMTDKLALAREALGDFFNVANPEDDYFVVAFSDRPKLLADATQSIGHIRATLASAVPTGHTALLDAIYMGLAKTRQARYKRRALVIISDGGDNRSRYTAAEIRKLVQETDVQIYAIGIFGTVFKTPEEWAGKRLLTQITEATGGRTITVNNARELPDIASAISLELRNQYVLGYHPSNVTHDGKWRKIRVQVTSSAPDTPLHAYFKTGYQAPER